MTTNIPPCLYLGQYSSQLNDEINKISLELLNSNNIDKSVIDIGLYNKKFDNKIIIENLMKVLEKFDTVTCLHYVSDLGLGNNSHTILQDIIDNFPGISLRSLHISPIDKLHGVSLINSIVNLETSLYTTDGIILRGFDDINELMTLSNKEGDNNGGRIQNYLSYMASDIFVAFCNSIAIKSSIFNNIQLAPEIHNNQCWPVNVCSTKKKIYDVRSSLWRYLRMNNYKNEYNSLRAMATNLHTLHSSIDQKLHPKFEAIGSANLINVFYHNNICYYSNIKSTSSEIKVALDWATPHIHWPNLVMNNNEFNLSSSLISEISRDTIFSSLSSSKIDNSSTNNSSSTSNSIIPPKEISALAFESQYARLTINNLCQKVKAILDIGAFNHSLIDYDIEEAYDALNYVSESVNLKL